MSNDDLRALFRKWSEMTIKGEDVKPLMEEHKDNQEFQLMISAATAFADAVNRLALRAGEHNDS